MFSNCFVQENYFPFTMNGSSAPNLFTPFRMRMSKRKWKRAFERAQPLHLSTGPFYKWSVIVIVSNDGNAEN